MKYLGLVVNILAAVLNFAMVIGLVVAEGPIASILVHSALVAMNVTFVILIGGLDE